MRKRALFRFSYLLRANEKKKKITETEKRSSVANKPRVREKKARKPKLHCSISCATPVLSFINFYGPSGEMWFEEKGEMEKVREAAFYREAQEPLFPFLVLNIYIRALLRFRYQTRWLV